MLDTPVRRRLSPRARIEDRIGRDPAEVIHDLVYRQGRSLKEAGQRFGVSESTAHRWLRDWMSKAAPEAVA